MGVGSRALSGVVHAHPLEAMADGMLAFPMMTLAILAARGGPIRILSSQHEPELPAF